MRGSPKNLPCRENPFRTRCYYLFPRPFRQDASSIRHAFVIVVFFIRKGKQKQEWNIVVTPHSLFFHVLIKRTSVSRRRASKLTTSAPVFGISRFSREQCFISATRSLTSENDTTRTRSPLLLVVSKSLLELRRIEINQSRWKSSFAVVVLPPADYIVAHVSRKQKKPLTHKWQSFADVHYVRERWSRVYHLV